MRYGTYYSDMVHRATCVYRLYDAADRLLYVGLSMSPHGRFEKHKRKPWWRDVERTEIEWFAGREAAKAAERSAIHHENPLHNITRPRMECC